MLPLAFSDFSPSEPMIQTFLLHLSDRETEVERDYVTAKAMAEL